MSTQEKSEFSFTYHVLAPSAGNSQDIFLESNYFRDGSCPKLKEGQPVEKALKVQMNVANVSMPKARENFCAPD